MRRGLLIAVAAALLAPAPALGAPVGAGDERFWSGPAAGDASCGERCWEYSFETAETADRLRLAVDHATVGEVWTVGVSGPRGESGSFSPGIGLYSEEELFEQPAAGTWTVRVQADPEVQDLRFRLRAKLERRVPAPPVPEVRLPNLQALPPWDFSFLYPVSNGGLVSVPSGSGSFGVPVPGGRTSCHPEEVVQEGAVRCLRMAYGVRNTGQGALELEVGPGAEFADRPLIQHVHVTDGSTVARDAGVAAYHHTHQHYHHDNATGLSLWRVVDRARGTLEPAGPEHLKGFAHRNELLREWSVFYPVDQSFDFGLRPGWGDYYEWDRPGNYIDLAANPDGVYVLRIVADPVNWILESNELDNASYSMIEIAGENVTLLESGRGSDPWDRCRILVPAGPEPELPAGAGGLRPPDCPPDSSGLPLPAAPAAAPPQNPAKAKKRRKAKRCPKAGRTRRSKARSRKCRRKQAALRRAAARRRDRG